MPPYQEQPQEEQGYYPPVPYTPEGQIDNIVEQINPQQIIDNLNHALAGEYYDKEAGAWKMNASGKELVNDECRGWIISYLTGIMNNASTMGIIDKQQLSDLMLGIILSVNKEFVVNLEKFGFVPPGKYYDKGIYENKGTPDSARMTSTSEMIFQRALLIYSRSLNGMESKKVFSSLSMTDALYGGMPQQRGNWMSKAFGG